MSHFETAEQRQIRSLRGSLRSLERELDRSKKEESRRKKELKDALRQMQKENQQQEQERQRLVQEMQQRQERERQRLVQEMQQRQDAARAGMSAALRALDTQMKERERKQGERIQAMHQQHARQMRQMETQFAQERGRLQGAIMDTRREMRQGLADLRVETDHRLSALSAETDRKLQEQKAENQRALSQMNAVIESQIQAAHNRMDTLEQQMAAREKGKKELAQYWSQEAARMVRRIRDTYRTQLLDQKTLTALEGRIRTANEDIAAGVYEAAIIQGRQAFSDAFDMQEELAAAELEWNSWFQMVTAREKDLLAALDSAENRVYEFDAKDGSHYEYTNGIDYWTRGQLTIVRERIAQCHRALAGADGMTLEQLQNAEKELRELQEQLALVENASHINVAMSVSRYETAGKIGEILGDHYAMIDADGEFFGREDREEYHAIFENPNTGDQVAAVITPVPDESGIVMNHIELIVGNADNNPVTRDRMAREVAGKLRVSGVEDCAFPCAGRFGDGTAREVSRVGDIEAVERGDEKVRASLPADSAQAQTAEASVRRQTAAH